MAVFFRAMALVIRGHGFFFGSAWLCFFCKRWVFEGHLFWAAPRRTPNPKHQASAMA